jgi:hypothetical protein
VEPDMVAVFDIDNSMGVRIWICDASKYPRQSPC